MDHATEMENAVDCWQRRREEEEMRSREEEELEIQIFVILYGYFYTIFLCFQSSSKKAHCLLLRRRE